MKKIMNLIISLIVLMALVVPSMAQISNNEKFDLSELSVISVSNTQNISEQEAFKMAQKITWAIEKQNEQEIQSSVNVNSQKFLQKSQLAAVTTATPIKLGTNVTFTTADCGDFGKSRWGSSIMFNGSDYNLSSRQAREVAMSGPAGAGGCGAWSWVGKSFYVNGTGSKAANIRMSGQLYGLTTAFGGGSSNTLVELVVLDQTTGTSYSTTIYQQSGGAVSWSEVNRSFNNGVTVNLQGGHQYIAYLKISGSAATYGAGEAGSDFGPWDMDNNGESVKYSNIVVSF
ncbi:hypothetical protein [Methanolapillus ohkumae]|uniref:Uncharacterized protein n=1 Tax=Methanolapillus ohkumae TaxID=3028298 RepID=A0AA96ZW54_9EURY|nr:hypothetical protein MsAm2_14230 [Methanosarcinaceae archaeon Am2]